MLIFMDTSALVKRYIDEEGSAEVDEYYTNDNRIAIAPITEMGFHSALKRKVVNESISSSTYDDAMAAWQMEKQSYDSVPFDDRLRQCAISTLKRHQLRTLDALQLASAIMADLDDGDEFVVADRRLCAEAQEVLSATVTLVG
jgi:hypothetical protein